MFCFNYTFLKENRLEVILETVFELIQQIRLKYYLNIVISFIPFLLSKLKTIFDLDRKNSKLLSLKTAAIKNGLTSK